MVEEGRFRNHSPSTSRLASLHIRQTGGVEKKEGWDLTMRLGCKSAQ